MHLPILLATIASATAVLQCVTASKKRQPLTQHNCIALQYASESISKLRQHFHALLHN
jgi:putative IMPACT (imprinted ancient) family translation regulator